MTSSNEGLCQVTFTLRPSETKMFPELRGTPRLATREMFIDAEVVAPQLRLNAMACHWPSGVAATSRMTFSQKSFCMNSQSIAVLVSPTASTALAPRRLLNATVLLRRALHGGRSPATPSPNWRLLKAVSRTASGDRMDVKNRSPFDISGIAIE